MLVFAGKLTVAPWDMAYADTEALRRAMGLMLGNDGDDGRDDGGDEEEGGSGSRCGSEDVERSGERLHSDQAIVDLTQCVGYFAFVNRIVAGLGVPLGIGEGEPGQ